jgi:hypothetical protein
MSGNVGAELSQALYLRVSTSRESSSYVWTFESPVSANGGILAYGGVSRRHPIDSHAGRYTPDAANFSAPSIRTTRRGDRILAFFSSTGTNGITPPKGMVERFDLVGQELDLEGAASVLAFPGATGIKRAVDAGATVNSSSFGQLVALRSACSAMTGRPRVGQRPAILGSAYVGRRLTTYAGAWCGKRPLRFTYRWQRCGSSGCAPIRGARSATYTPTKRDVEMSLTFTVTARNTSGTTTVKSSPKQVGRTRPMNTSPPTISGTAEEELELTASTGSWTGLEPMTYAYQWRRCDASGSGCASVAGANNSTYVLTSADVGGTIRVVVTASNSSGSKSATSGKISVVAPSPSAATAPSDTALPAISGSASQGSTLTGSSGTWSGTAPISYGYQWQRCDSAGATCSSVSGATAQAYLLGAADVGSTLRLLVTASNAGGSSSAASPATAVVSATATPPLNTTPPSITGTATVGSLLSASTGTWTGTTPIGYTYQWRRCDQAGANCSSISEAKSASYQVSYADEGSTTRVLVTAVNPVGSNVATSAQTAVVPTTTSGYPASFFTGPAGTNILLPPGGGYPSKGAWIGEEPANGLTQTASREQYFGRRFNIYAFYAQNRCDPYPTILANVVSAGYIPLISWYPTPFYADQIIRGDADNCIKSFGNAIANQPSRLFIRPYWEFNGGWMNFSKNSDGTRATANQEKQMWQHTVDVLRTTNALSKASLVWCPHEGYYNNGDAYNNPTPYPGENYVDWVCSDVYNHNSSTAWCGPHAGWCTFAESFTHGAYAPKYAPRGVEVDFRGKKPFMVGETGSVEDPNTPGRKGQWMMDMGNYAKTYMPGLYAILYFDLAYSTGDWSLDSSTSAMDGFKSFANDPYFNVPNQ